MVSQWTDKVLYKSLFVYDCLNTSKIKRCLSVSYRTSWDRSGWQSPSHTILWFFFSNSRNPSPFPTTRLWTRTIQNSSKPSVRHFTPVSLQTKAVVRTCLLLNGTAQMWKITGLEISQDNTFGKLLAKASSWCCFGKLVSCLYAHFVCHCYCLKPSVATTVYLSFNMFLSYVFSCTVPKAVESYVLLSFVVLMLI